MKMKRTHVVFLLPLTLFLCCKPTSELPLPGNTHLYSLTGADTRIVFNEPVDLRHAWLGNDAEDVNFETEILTLVNDATQTIDVSTMTFTKYNIAEALAAKAASGTEVRIVGAGFRRWQPGYWRSMAGGCEVVDENLPALVHRISFQQEATAPAGWLVDRGNVFGPRGGGLSYGWTVDKTAKMMNHGLFPNPVIDNSFVQSNSEVPGVWEMELPEGYYYVHLMVGQASEAFHPRNFILVEGQRVFGTSGGFVESFTTNSAPDHSDMFKGCAVDQEAGPRLHVTDGRLTVQVGKQGESSFSALAYIEIYRADPDFPNGDRCYTSGTDNEVQERHLQHAKYILTDRNTPDAKLWASSGNLTQGMDLMSEDAIISTNDGLCGTFAAHFNQQWGANALQPNVAGSNFGMCKTAVSPLDLNINGFPWKVRFSPSLTGAGGYDMATTVRNYINASNRDLVMVLEQFRPSPGFRSFEAPADIWNTTIPGKLASPNYRVFAMGGAAFDTNPWNTFSNAHVAFVDDAEEDLARIHNKYALTDVLHDTRYSLTGKVLCGSMNWSQSGMHTNDEQTLIIENPYVANQYLQHATQKLREYGIPVDERVDIVLVIDRSLSMLGATEGPLNKMEAAKEAAKLFLDIVETGQNHRVSLVRFGTTVEAFSPAIGLGNYTDGRRTELKARVDAIEATAPIGNSTCYGAALQEAMTQLSGPGGNPRKLVHFFTDGRENQTPMANTVYPALAGMGVEIHSTGFGVDAITGVLEDMANASAGTYEHASLDVLELNKRFAEVARDAMNLATVLDPRYTLTAKTPITEKVYIDKAAKRIKFVLSWEGKQKERPLSATLITPDGKKLDANSEGVKFIWEAGYLLIDVAQDKKNPIQMEGYWQISFVLNGRQEALRTDLMVYSDTDIRLYAEVLPRSLKRGQDVILLARMLEEGKPVLKNKIQAQVTLPFTDATSTRKTITVALYDDGRHNDKKANDGLFGAALKLKNPGNHSFLFISEASTAQGNGVRRDARATYNWGLNEAAMQEFLKRYQDPKAQ